MKPDDAPKWYYGSDQNNLKTESSMNEDESKVKSPSWMKPSDQPSEKDPILRKWTPNGRSKKRKCTDPFFFFIFIACWVALLVTIKKHTTINQIQNYQDYVIAQGIDYTGTQCTLTKKRYLYFPEPSIHPSFSICVASCPKDSMKELEVPLLVDYRRRRTMNSTVNVTFTPYATNTNGFFCKPIDDFSISSASITPSGYFEVGIASALVASIISVLYLFLMRCGSGVLPILSLLIAIAALLFNGIHFIIKTSNISDHYELSKVQTIPFFLATCIIVIMIFYTKRFLLATPFVRYASKILRGNKSFLPSLFYACIAILMLYCWCTHLIISVASSGNIVPTLISLDPKGSINIMTQSWERLSSAPWIILFIILLGCWSVKLVTAVIESIICNVVSLWYFSSQEQRQLYQGRDIWAGFVSAVYHMGTLCISAFVDGFLNILRHFLRRQCRPAKRDNSFSCCSELCHCYTEFVCKEAQYVTEIQGTNYSDSAKIVTELYIPPFVRIGSTEMIGIYSIFPAKIFVTMVTYFICLFLLPWTRFSILFQIIILLFSFSISTVFFKMYETTINTMILCFIMDEMMHGGQGHAVFSDPRLLIAVNENLRPSWNEFL